MSPVNQNALYRQKTFSHPSAVDHKECQLFSIKLVLVQFGCRSSVPNNGGMTDCFFLYYEMISYDVTNSIALHFFMLTLRKTILSFSPRKCEIQHFISRERLDEF